MSFLNQAANSREPSAMFKQAIKVPISELLLEVSGVQAVMLATTDGFEVATASYRKDLDNAKLAGEQLHPGHDSGFCKRNSLKRMSIHDAGCRKWQGIYSGHSL